MAILWPKALESNLKCHLGGFGLPSQQDPFPWKGRLLTMSHLWPKPFQGLPGYCMWYCSELCLRIEELQQKCLTPSTGHEERKGLVAFRAVCMVASIDGYWRLILCMFKEIVTGEWEEPLLLRQPPAAWQAASVGLQDHSSIWADAWAEEVLERPLCQLHRIDLDACSQCVNVGYWWWSVCSPGPPRVHTAGRGKDREAQSLQSEIILWGVVTEFSESCGVCHNLGSGRTDVGFI